MLITSNPPMDSTWLEPPVTLSVKTPVLTDGFLYLTVETGYRLPLKYVPLRLYVTFPRSASPSPESWCTASPIVPLFPSRESTTLNVTSA